MNFRGSTGFGKKFVNAGNKEWAGKMHDDLLDAVDWAVKEKIADAGQGRHHRRQLRRLCHAGRPDVHARRFACGVDIVGPSNLMTLLASIPPYWTAFIEVFDDARRRSAHRGGQEAAGRALAADARRQDQEAAADRPGRERPARQAGGGRPDREGDEGQEDSGDVCAVPRRRPRLRAAAEPLVVLRGDRGLPGQYLGGRFEPIGNDFKGANLKVLEGAEKCPAWPTP